MKKLIVGLAFLGAFAFVKPMQVKASTPCVTTVIYCADGTSHTCVCCDGEDFEFWRDHYCGADTN